MFIEMRPLHACAPRVNAFRIYRDIVLNHSDDKTWDFSFSIYIGYLTPKYFGAVQLQGRIPLQTSDECLIMDISVLEALV